MVARAAPASHAEDLGPARYAQAPPIDWRHEIEQLSSMLGLSPNAPLAGLDFEGLTTVTSSYSSPAAQAFTSFTWPFPDGTYDASLDLSRIQHTSSSSDASLVSVEDATAGCDVDFGLPHSSDDRWFLWSPGPTGTTPPLVKHSMENLLRVMKTWPSMLAKGLQPPPMLHSTHTSPENLQKPMVNCVALARMWAGQGEGASECVRRAVLQEMRFLFETVSGICVKFA